METAAELSTAHLHSYLADHLAGSTAGVGLAEDLAEQNAGNGFFAELADKVRKDRDALERLMEKLDAPPSAVKQAGASMAQKVGTGISGATGGAGEHLGIAREAEMLTMGIVGKLCLWEALEEITDSDDRLAGFNFASLIEGAQSQLEGLTAERRKLARKAFLH